MRRRTAITAAGTLFASGGIGTVTGKSAVPTGEVASVSGTPPGERVSAAIRQENGPFSIQEIETDRTRIRIDLRENGDAAWRIEFWTRLDDDETEAAFQSVEDDIESDPDQFLESFSDRMETTIATAREDTGREMSADGFSVEAERETIPEEFGLITYTFQWRGFAVTEGSEVVAGDAIDGFLLEEGTRLAIQWPEGYEIVGVDPDPDDRSDPNRLVVWFGGSTEFLPGQPTLRVSTGPDGIPMWFAAGTVVSLLALIGAVFYLFGRGSRHERSEGDRDLGTKPFERETETEGTESTNDTASEGDATDSDGETTASTGGSVGAGSGASDGEPPEELLSNEERVLNLLEENGGRMKQQGIVQELDWTDAKTSKVVTGLREEDRVEVYRIGRENVVALPGESDI